MSLPSSKFAFLGFLDHQLTLFFIIEIPKTHFLAQNLVILVIVGWNEFIHFCCRRQHEQR